MEYIGDVFYEYGGGLYANLTNKCPCRCEFCIRDMVGALGDADSLWLRREPTLDEIKELLREWDLNQFYELVFCGYGEPTERLSDLLGSSERSYTTVYSAFLDPAQISLAAGVREFGGMIDFVGGYDGAERCLARLRANEYCEEVEPPIVLITARATDKSAVLSHRDVLGALMGLGRINDFSSVRVSEWNCCSGSRSTG